MERLTRDQFARELDAYDRDVAAMADIDRFCSSSSWIVPAADALMPGRSPWIARGEAGWIALMRGRRDDWHYLEPFEASWGLACPLIGRHPERLAAELARLAAAGAGSWRVMLLCGIPARSALLAALVGELSARFLVRPGAITERCVADLAGGVDGFLARRTANFRKTLKKAQRAASDAGIVFERARAATPAEADAVYDRILAVERRSWKGLAGVGIDRGSMSAFYRAMMPRLAARGALRVIFARAEIGGAPADVAYVLGGTFGRTYRGLQFSFDDRLGSLGLGNLCQLREIEDLCAEGFERYDLGTDMPYKRRWAEGRQQTVSVIALAT